MCDVRPKWVRKGCYHDRGRAAALRRTVENLEWSSLGRVADCQLLSRFRTVRLRPQLRSFDQARTEVYFPSNNSRKRVHLLVTEEIPCVRRQVLSETLSQPRWNSRLVTGRAPASELPWRRWTGSRW